MTTSGKLAGIGAVVLAAGRSQRMGTPKMALPWGSRTVIGQVVFTLAEAGMNETDVVVVTGGAHAEVKNAVAGFSTRLCFNPDFAGSEMLTSLQVGLRCCEPSLQAAMVVLGDQPFITAQTIQMIAAQFTASQARLVVPSYQMRRGHPWVIRRDLWAEIDSLPSDQSPRDFLNRHAVEILYVPVDTPEILKDLDTPEDYAHERPG